MSEFETMKMGWYLIKTKSRSEFKAVKNLHNQHFETFCPVVESDNIEDKDKPLFPGYLFLFLDETKSEQHYKIRSTLGVSDFVRFNRVDRGLYADGRISGHDIDVQKLLPQPIPRGDKIIKEIKELVHHLKTRKGGNLFLEKGDNVMICHPLYEHLKATFVKGLSNERGLVLIEYIQRQRNKDGTIIKANTTPVKEITVKMSEMKKIRDEKS